MGKHQVLLNEIYFGILTRPELFFKVVGETFLVYFHCNRHGQLLIINELCQPDQVYNSTTWLLHLLILLAALDKWLETIRKPQYKKCYIVRDSRL